MEYQFTHSMHGVIARCSMDHEAFARWLNTEITENSKDLSLILTEIERCKQAFPNQYPKRNSVHAHLIFPCQESITLVAHLSYSSVCRILHSSVQKANL